MLKVLIRPSSAVRQGKYDLLFQKKNDLQANRYPPMFESVGGGLDPLFFFERKHVVTFWQSYGKKTSEIDIRFDPTHFLYFALVQAPF